MSRSGRGLSGAGTTGLIITVRTNLRNTGTRNPGEAPQHRLAWSTVQWADVAPVVPRVAPRSLSKIKEGV